MKKTLLFGVIGLAASVISSYAQGGYIAFDNYNSTTNNPPITYGPAVPANGEGGAPGTIGGGLNTNWTVGLYYVEGNVSITDPAGNGIPVSPLALGTGPGSTAQILYGGYFAAGGYDGYLQPSDLFQATATTPGPGGAPVTVEVVAYDTADGSYAAAHYRGHSAPFIMNALPLTNVPPNFVGDYMQGFSVLVQIPNTNAQFSYGTNSDGTITVTGGTGVSNDVIIPSVINGLTVTAIGDDAFELNRTMTGVSIPSTVTSIGVNAFGPCSLNSVTIPNSVTNIGNNAFYGCIYLTSVTIGSGVSFINSLVFANCPSLTSAYFLGNAPGWESNYFSAGDGTIFENDPVTVYCYQGATGWGSTFGDVYYNIGYGPVHVPGAPVVVLGVGTNPPSITSQPQDELVTAYGSASFSCTVTGTLHFSYQWSLNSTNILNATNSFLNILQAEPSDLGGYVCVVTNAYGAVTSSVANLYMYPYLESPFGGAISYWGKDTTLSVGAWGTWVEYQWYDNGVAVPNATNSTLTIPAIQYTNAGLYSVVVSSAFGSVTNTPEQVVVNPANIGLGLFPGVKITGTVGYNIIIQSTVDLGNTNSWVTETNLTLTQPFEIWSDLNADTTQPNNPHKFYRVLPRQ